MINISDVKETKLPNKFTLDVEQAPLSQVVNELAVDYRNSLKNLYESMFKPDELELSEPTVHIPESAKDMRTQGYHVTVDEEYNGHTNGIYIKPNNLSGKAAKTNSIDELAAAPVESVSVREYIPPDNNFEAEAFQNFYEYLLVLKELKTRIAKVFEH